MSRRQKMDMEPEIVVKDKSQVVKKALSELISTKYRSAVRFHEKDLVLDAMCEAVANKGRYVQPVVRVQKVSEMSRQEETKVVQTSYREFKSSHREVETIVRSSNIRKVRGYFALGWIRGLGGYYGGIGWVGLRYFLDLSVFGWFFGDMSILLFWLIWKVTRF